MKVRELIQHLKNYDMDAEVFTAQDPEGNGFGRVHEVCICHEDRQNQVVIWPSDQYDELPEE